MSMKRVHNGVALATFACLLGCFTTSSQAQESIRRSLLGQGSSGTAISPSGRAVVAKTTGSGVRRVQATTEDLQQVPANPSPSLPPVAPAASATDVAPAPPSPIDTNTDLSLPASERELGAGSPTGVASAGEATSDAEKKNESTTLLMKALGAPGDAPVKIYGWLQNSYTGNTNGRPKSGENFGVNPNHRANSWQGNQYYLIVENPLEQNDEINFGFRVDSLYGNDWQFNKAYGFADNAFKTNGFSGFDLAQAYGEVHLPWLTKGGIDIKGGRMYTLAGYEQVPATARPLLSVPYMFNYGQPFTHFAAMTTLHLTDKINIYNGAINGWDRWINSNYKWGYMGGFSVTSKDDKTSFAFTTVWGPNQFPNYLPTRTQIYPTGTPIPPKQFAGQVNTGYGADQRVLFTSVLTRKWTDKFTQVMETDQANEQAVPFANTISPKNKQLQSAGWYSFGNWFLYQFTPKLTGVWRSEIFRDNNGVRTGIATNYSEFTLGAIYKPKDWIWIRPEARYDFARSGHPYSDGTRNSMFTLAFDVIFLF